MAKQVPRRRVPIIDIDDALALGGLGLLATGLWLLAPAAALIVLGSLFLAAWVWKHVGRVR